METGSPKPAGPMELEYLNTAALEAKAAASVAQVFARDGVMAGGFTESQAVIAQSKAEVAQTALDRATSGR